MRALSKPNYPIWYCREYPVKACTFSTRTSFDREDELRPVFLEHIRTHGLINPLIVLNHRTDSYKRRYVMTGNNKLWAVRTLGWETVPAIVTGDCEFECEPVDWDYILDYFPDATEVYLGNHGPRLRGWSDFTKGEYPTCLASFP